MGQRNHLRLFLFFLLFVFFLTLFPNLETKALASQSLEGNFITIPLSALEVNEATATVSVLHEPESSVSSLLRACQSNFPDELVIEGQDVAEEIKKLCAMVERFTRQHTEKPKHHLSTKGYTIAVPLKEPYQRIQSLVWNTTTLDDAIAFVDLLQSGNLKAVKVYSTIPWSTTSEPCVECPIKELVFHAAGIKEQLRNLKRDRGNARSE